MHQKEEKHLRFEIAISKRLQHPNVVSMLQVLQSSKGIYIIQEYISGGSLATLLKKRGKLPQIEATRYMRQLLDGLAYCHSCNAAHRDLKPENLLVDSENNIKITDFGFAANTFGNGLEEKLLYTRCGSPFYVSPEVIFATDTRGYDGKKADIWSCGVILYQMLAGTVPFVANTYKVLYSLIRSCQYVDAGLPPSAATLIRKILCPATDRLTMAQIVAHPWFMGAKSPVYPRKSVKPTEAEIASAIDPVASSLMSDLCSPFGSPRDSPLASPSPVASPSPSPLPSPLVSPSSLASPLASPVCRRANVWSCNNVEIQQKKLFGNSTICTNARVTILDDKLIVVVKAQQVRSPPFPLPLSQIKSVKPLKSGDKILMGIELKSSMKMIFVFHITSKADQSAAERLHSKLSTSVSSATKK